MNADGDYILAMSVMRTVGPEGLCPSLLAFGAMPMLPLSAFDLLQYRIANL